MMCGLKSVGLIALVLCHTGFAQFLDERCGDPFPIEMRIARGHPAQSRLTTWMAGLYNGSSFKCGATLIHKSYVLTAAHCVYESSLAEVSVHLGEYDKSCSPEKCPHVERLNVNAIIVHPEFNDYDSSHDIALLRLEHEVIYKLYIRPICIILDEMVTSDGVQTFSAFGWGATHKERESKTLNTIELQRRSDDKCHYIRVNQICAGNNDGGDSCRGDSGGPLAVSYSYRGKDIYVQFGVVSNGVEACNDSAVYTDVNAYKYWIANTVLEAETRLLTEHCGSDWGSGILVRLWEISLFEHNFTGALITSRFVVTVASAFPNDIHEIKVETEYLGRYDVDWFHKHPQFTDSAGSTKNNIAVIKLAKNVPDSVLVKPICMGLNTAAPMTWTAMLYSSNDEVAGTQSVTLNRIDNAVCSRKIGIPVEPNQFCVEKPDELMYMPYNTPGSVVATVGTINGVEKYLLAGLISLAKDGVIVITNIQDHEKWIANELKY
ncbi:serine protease 45-like [Drosophila elegans]|uniref:serine protease 45-like n=1 Tax=Drosophila elegans TaxID=30023 RepID=UPI0007E7C90A|nr:serine protease 45-like [Drosophila elegans]